MKSGIKDELFQEMENIIKVGSGGEVNLRVIPQIAPIAVDIYIIGIYESPCP